MSDKEQRATRTFDPTGELESSSGPGVAGVLAGNELIPHGKAGDTQVSVLGAVVTAVRVAVPRDIANLRAEIKALAAMAGSRWVYRIPFKNNKTGQTDFVEGATVKCTNSVFRAYGNCHLTTVISTEGDSWIFYSRIVDLQKGSTYDRPYQQRKQQDTGMKDKARAADMVFQIGVSKSQRNVVANFLEDLVSYAVEEAKKGVLDRVKKNPDGARQWILDQLKELEIDVARVAAVYGRTAEHWTIFDMAKMFAELNGIDDGMIDPDDIYPVPMSAEDKKKQADDDNPIATRTRTTAKKDEPKVDDKPKAEEKKEPDPEQQQGSPVVGKPPAVDDGGRIDDPKPAAKKSGPETNLF